MHEGHTHSHEHHADADKTLALLTYMLDHNKHHAQELHDMAHMLEHHEKYEAAALIVEALNYYRDGNDKLEAALEQVKGE